MSRPPPKARTARALPFVHFGLRFLPALALLATVLWVSHPAVLLLLLLANAFAVAAVCDALDLGLEDGFWRLAMRRGSAYFLLFGGYLAVVSLLLGFPLTWLLRAPTLEATLALSATSVLALVLLWRWWAAFGLVFLWDDAYAESPNRSWLWGALRRSLAFSAHLTAEHELFFSHGLPVSLLLLALAQGALALTGFYGVPPSEWRVLGAGLYALALPLSAWVIANRTLRALVAGTRAESTAPLAAEPADTAPILASGLGPAELAAALLRATRAGDVELALAALERGADPNAVPPAEDRDQRSVLVLAALLPEVRLLRALIAKRGDVNLSHQGLTPLVAATRDSQAGRPDAVLTLLANGADTSKADAEGNTPLHHAARAADPTVAAMLLDAGASLGVVNRDGHTPLGCAAGMGNWTLTRFLLERGAKPDVEHGVPALIPAAQTADDDPTGVKLLLRHKARVDACGPLDRTALMAAALHGHRLVAKALLDAGADANHADRHGTTAAMEAARAGAVDVLRLLESRKADFDRQDASGRSALTIACQSRQATPDAVKVLLGAGADTTLAARDGKRAVDCAAMAGRWDLVALVDPAFPLPAHVADMVRGAPLPGADSPAHLLDALRFGHWNVADDFRDALQQWSDADRAEILHALGDDDDDAARRWLLGHGLPPDIALADGTRVIDAWLARLPRTLSACRHLLDAGAKAGGAGVPRRVLETAREHPVHHTALLQLALDWLQRGGDPFDSNAQGETALHLAAGLGAVELVDWLLQHGVDPNARDGRGATPLHAALRVPGQEAIAVTRSLIRAGARPDAAAANGETCLGIGLARAQPELLQWLQWRQWPLPARALRDSDLPAAAAAGDGEAVAKLIALGLPLDAVDNQGASALLRACGLGHLALVQRLLEAGADAEFAAPTTGATCLSAAVSTRRGEVVECLLKHGVSLDRRLPGGGTALMIAAALGYPDVTQRLLAAGAGADLADEKGTTALHAAALFAFQHKDTARARAVLQALCHAGAQPNPRNAKGQTPLLLLLGARADPGAPCHAGHIAAVLPLLLDHGAELDAQDERGVSPLHACAIHGLLGPAQQLLARGASREARDCLGRRPGDLAQLLGYAELAQQLGGAAPVPSLAQMLRQPARPVE